jgi:signal transduction histidine kinase
VNELVTLNRGTIEVRSEPARGTVFSVCLPLAAPVG